MKKRIISVLSFLMLVICLTGCSAQVTQAKMVEMTEIAQNIRDNSNYQLPEGYSLRYADNTKNDRIILMTKEEVNGNNQVEATFDISKEKVELIQIRVVVDTVIDATGMVILMIILCGLCFCIGVLCS